MPCLVESYHLNIWIWVGFHVFILAVLAIDLGVIHRRAHEVGVREAAAWSGVWVFLSLAFAAGVAHFLGSQAGLEFLTGYLIEKALSVDNIFVFVLIFSYFRVPSALQHRVLFWGILGALVMRGAFIFAGVLLLEQFHWVIYVFGAFLVITGIRMAIAREANIDVEANPILRLLRKVVPVSGSYHGQQFFARARFGGRVRLVATPLLVVLALVETTDVIFALDSIPAVFAVTREPFIVYTSNVFAIIGLRALYFLLAGIIDRFQFLKLGLAVVLVLVGIKMLATDIVEIPIGISLGVIGSVLAVSIAASLLLSKRLTARSPVEHPSSHQDAKP